MTAKVDDPAYVKDMTDTGNLTHRAFDMLHYKRWQNPFLLARDAKKTECSGRDHWHSACCRIIIVEINMKRIPTSGGVVKLPYAQQNCK